jgi:hypothetical protein
VRYGIYESNEEMLARVMGGNSGWDVVFPTDYIVKPMLANDLLAPVHREELPNLAQLEPRFQKPDWDPDLKWSMPLHGDRRRHRLQPQAESPAPRLGRYVGPEAARPDDHARRSVRRDRCVRSRSSVFSVNSPPIRCELRSRSAPRRFEQKPLLRAYLNAEARDQLVSWRRTGRAHVEHHRATGHGLIARRRIRVSGGRLCRLSGLRLSSCVKASGRNSRTSSCNFLLRPDIAAANALAARTTTTNAGARKILPPEVPRQSDALSRAGRSGTRRMGQDPGPLRAASERSIVDRDQVRLMLLLKTPIAIPY